MAGRRRERATPVLRRERKAKRLSAFYTRLQSASTPAEELAAGYDLLRGVLARRHPDQEFVSKRVRDLVHALEFVAVELMRKQETESLRYRPLEEDRHT